MSISGSDIDDDLNYSEDEESEIEESGELEDFEIQFGTLDITEFNYRVNMGAKLCSCVAPIDDESAIGILLDIANSLLVVENVNCTLNNVIGVCNYALENFIDLNDERRLAFADTFYKTRHELLFKALMLTLNLPASKSDLEFSILGIDSVRTPDYLKIEGKNVTILEIAVTSNFEKTAKIKGLQSSGYEPKYQKEINELENQGFLVNYIIFIFDMTSYDVSYHKSCLEKVKDEFHINSFFTTYLDLIYKELCTITYNMKAYLFPVSTFLFTDIIPIEDEHDKLGFLYEKEPFEIPYHYKKMTVSSQVYNKVSTLWDRLLNIYEYCNKDFTGRYSPVLSLTNNRIRFEHDDEGYDFEEIREIIMTNDKPNFFKKLYLSVGNSKFPAIGSETGVDFIDKIGKKEKDDREVYNMPNLTSHVRVPVKRTFKDMAKYKKIINKVYNCSYNPAYFDCDYEDLILKKIRDFDNDSTGGTFNHEVYNSGLKLNLLQENKLNEIDIDLKMSEINNMYKSANSFETSIPLKIQRMKQSFILPISSLSSKDYCSLKEKNEDFIKELYKNLENNEYTKLICLKILDENFSFYEKQVQPSSDYLNKKSLKFEYSNKMTALYKKYLISLPRGSDKKFVKLKDCDNNELKEEYFSLKKSISSIDKDLDKTAKEEGLKRTLELLRMPTKNRKTVLGSYFQSETAHFKDRSSKFQSTIEGFGIPDNLKNEFTYCQESLKSISDNLTDYRGDNPDILIDLETYEDSRLLKDLKEKAITDYKDLINDVKNSYLGHACSFVSRMAHSLLYYSQMPFNSDYIRVDNLGYKNCLLFVRGGKKIFKSKSSKMFRIVYPIDEEILNFYIDDSIGPSNYKTFLFEGVRYLISPWMLLHESILTDSISFYPRVMSFCVLNSNPTIPFKRQFHKYFINVLLAFHNRRQTEVCLANMRYILLSTMGDYAGIMQIFDEFCGFNYDRFQFFIRTSIMMNYQDFFKKMKAVKLSPKSDETKFFEMGVKNLFTCNNIENSDDLTLMIYSTFLMTKGPYQRPVERAINLLGILKIHDSYIKQVGPFYSPQLQLEEVSVTLNESKSFKEYCDDLFRNDFIIDPKYISCLGVFANSYYSGLNLKDRFQVEWIKILNQEWDSMATSTGLRGRPKDVEDFWGKKGYFVIYKFLLKDKEYVEQTKKLFDCNIDDNSKSKLLKTLNQTYLEKLKFCKEKSLLFHAVDKVQWRGSREIYVMDLDTKILQQPIEKMMAFLCKNIDNELISIPTDKRAQVIHHAIFEKDLPLKDTLTWFLTLDCSKWAPKSMFIKFAIMLTCMPVLPPSFVCHFLNYTEKLFYKRIYFNSAEVKVLKNNETYKDLIKKYLNFDKDLDGYYLLMPYSWVMGIFNYTSSFMHAFNQKYASYLINKSSSVNFSEEVSMVMFAHSDDSGGRITSVSQNLVERGLILYEVQLKCCNHLLSRKKSVVSRIYFEILSIIYLFKRLMALLPKFLGGLRFTPTDKGPGHDMLQSYSKCIEVMVAGSDFSIAYLIMKFFSMMIWRFYYNKRPSQGDYSRPVQYFGIPDAHPLMVLLTGSDSDILRLMATKNTKVTKVLHKMLNEINLNFDDEGLIRPLKFNIKVRNIQKGFEDQIEFFKDITNSWTIGNVNFKATPFNALNFLKKLNDPGFVGSLVNETPVRRISRSYYIRKGDSVLTSKGNFTLNDIMSAVKVVTDFVLKGENSDLNFIKEFIGDDFTSKLEVYSNTDDGDEPLFKIMKNVLAGPLKLHTYFDRLSLENKDMRQVRRTLKPTQVQLLKTGSFFSNNFDASQLVSFVKEPSYRWALPDIRNLSKASDELDKLLFNLDLKIEDLDESSLLKLIRSHVTKTQKDIHLYSQVPGEIRTIKTYASMLIFLSTNSIRDIEIGGLALKLKGSLTDPGYVETSINEDVYYINTLCSIILMLIKGKFKIDISQLIVKSIPFINWEEETMLNFIHHIQNNKYSLIDFNHIQLYSDYISAYIKDQFEISSSILINKSYYVFLKEQKRKSGWYGSGQLLISVANKFFIFNLLGPNITSVESNHKGKIDKLCSSFIFDTCQTCGINLSSNYFKPNTKIPTELGFGFDHVNELSILEKREISRGVPFNRLVRSPLFINQLDFGVIKHLRENLFICEMKVNEEIIKYKVYGLKINKTNIVETIKDLFYPEDFKKILIEEGIEDLSEFILTEILTEFREEITITKEEVFDAIFASELYKIFAKVKEQEPQVLPKQIKTALIPAEEGSLPRILLTYGEITGENIIKDYKSYDPIMLSIRSEYPENFSIILSEKLVECHKKLFDPEENKEMLNSYVALTKMQDKNKLRKCLIDLMCYWGYGSLVNAINIYDFTKKKDNYSIIRINNAHSVSMEYYHVIYKNLIKSIIDCMVDFSVEYEYLEPNVKGLGSNLTLIEMLRQFLKYLTHVGYGYKIPINFLELPSIYFYNALSGFLKNVDFCEKLTSYFSNKQILSTLPIDYNYKRELFALMNTLKIIYFVGKGIDHRLNYVNLIERLPVNIVEPAAILKEFNEGLINNKDIIYHHGFLNNYMVKKLKSRIRLDSGGKKFFINQTISELSEKVVYMSNTLKIVRPLSDEMLESELWEELCQELSFEEQDEITIKEMWEGRPPNVYAKRETHAKEGIVRLDLKWLILPYSEGHDSFMGKLRQVGENVAIITTSFIDISNFPYSFKFLTNFTEIAGTNLPDVFIYCFGNKTLNKRFWCDLIGENELNLSESQLKTLCLRDINTNSGISDTLHFSSISSEEILMSNFQDLTKKIEDLNKDTTPVEEENRKYNLMNEIDIKLSNAVKEGLININMAEKLKNKYYSYHKEKSLSITNILESLLEDIDLNSLNNMFLQILDGGLTKKQVIKIYQTPEHFGLSQSTDRTDSNPIMNSKLRAEIEALCVGLSNKIASGSLTISNKVLKLVKSSMKIWKSYVMGTDYKKENKKFLLKVMNSIFNCAFRVDDSTDDFIWHSLIDNVQVLIAQGEEDDEEENDDYISFDYNILQSSRLRYRFSGFQ